MVHDFMVTSDYILFPIMPLTGSIERAMSGLPVYGSRQIGACWRDAEEWKRQRDEIFTGEAAIFHPMIRSQSGIIYCDVCEYPAPLFPFADGSTGDLKKPTPTLFVGLLTSQPRRIPIKAAAR